MISRTSAPCTNCKKFRCAGESCLPFVNGYSYFFPSDCHDSSYQSLHLGQLLTALSLFRRAEPKSLGSKRQRLKHSWNCLESTSRHITRVALTAWSQYKLAGNDVVPFQGILRSSNNKVPMLQSVTESTSTVSPETALHGIFPM